MPLQSPCAVVTGGSGGIGIEVSRRLAADGLPVAITYRSNAARADALVQELTAAGGRARADQVDLADNTQVADWAQDLTTGFGQPAVLVHAAGPHIPMVHLSKVSPDTFSAHLGAEAAAFFSLVHGFLPALRETRGSVVAVTTAATDRYPVRDGLSAGTKGAVEALVRAFAAEEGRFGVRFNAVGPGMLTDGMAERLMGNSDLDERAQAVAMSRIPLQRFGSAADIAEAVCFLASAKAGFVTGQKLNVDGGYTV
ncbi:SDR family oxidoreductase [Rhodococcus spelaei]|uniref:SDR family oxidoreductase n=1 Tax=Rhodococcus spelaei TaxID=2546320 RepID=A0A541BS15_9NOCA|nr:SDR family oxidoreductase [Rhodococcus spelaei]TQF75130.1 SDR family oxidoreductase [Rhodococcus spelaei]